MAKQDIITLPSFPLTLSDCRPVDPQKELLLFSALPPTKPVRCKVLGLQGPEALSLHWNCAFMRKLLRWEWRKSLSLAAERLFLASSNDCSQGPPSVRSSSVFQIIPWKDFLIAGNGVSSALRVVVCFFLTCEEQIFHCYRHAIKFPAFGENCGCQHTQRTCKPCLVENLFEAVVILKVTNKSGDIPFSVLFSRFGHEYLTGLRESLPCIPVVGNV